MNIRINIVIGCLLLGGLLGGCASKRMVAPVPKLTKGIAIKQVWSNKTAQSEHTYFAPQSVEAQIVDAGNNRIKFINVETGRTDKEIKLNKKFASGLGTNGSIFVLASDKGEIFAYNAKGEVLWQKQASSEILAPALVTNEGHVILRTIDGRITAYKQEDGRQVWQFMRPLPSLSVRNYAPVTAVGGLVFAGLANGQLVGLIEKNATVIWETQVAYPKGVMEVERAVDVLSRPLIVGQSVCAAAYQGRIGCFEGESGTPLWTQEMGSGVDLATDGQAIFGVTSDAEVRAFDVTNGSPLWRLDKLKGRELGAPAVFGQYLVFGDMEGYVYFLNKSSGEIEGISRVGRAPIKQQPIILHDMVLIKTTRGLLAALRA